MTTNVTGRAAYLKALQREWPEALRALQNDVFPLVAYLWKDKAKQPAQLDFSIENIPEFLEVTRSEEVAKALRYWARDFSVSDEWMLNVARFTIFLNGENLNNYQGDWRGWVDWPPIAQRPMEVKLIGRLWIPPEQGGFETWEEFTERLNAQLKEQLLRYRKQTSLYYGTPKENMDRDAGWTVRYQKGERAFTIAEGLIRHGDPEQAVYRAVERFAGSIGLTLPKTPKRRTRK